MRGKVVQWPWADRGRSAVTEKNVRNDIEKLSRDFHVHVCMAAGLVRL
jgi:hypothetical protein